jgi:hypothetical protein
MELDFVEEESETAFLARCVEQRKLSSKAVSPKVCEISEIQRSTYT